MLRGGYFMGGAGVPSLTWTGEDYFDVDIMYLSQRAGDTDERHV